MQVRVLYALKASLAKATPQLAKALNYYVCLKLLYSLFNSKFINYKLKMRFTFFFLMTNLFILIETYTNGFKSELLDYISFVAILCGVFVIISKNPIVSVLFLIGLFLSISSYLIMLGINFIGLSYLLVYVGAVSILFLFILMLINVRISELLSDSSNSIPLAILVSFIFYSIIYEILPYNAIIVNSNFSLKRFFNISNNNSETLYVTSKL
jgi:NADH-ubiquinone oxidoreductase chain 6